ncbi:MAG: hypothetical protein QF654_01755 [Alphaproteobacteria bacterium]|nr:hypothetical protein [Alphaproteobacteria bacterium]MDP6603097.1 hypothetical protein [Rhodospirillales bacterium]
MIRDTGILRLAAVAVLPGLAVLGVFDAAVSAAALEHPIVVSETQEGVVGVTGTRWTVDPDGVWRIEKFVNNEIAKFPRRGALAPDALACLEDMVTRHGIATLPDLSRVGPRVNRRSLTIEHAGRRATVVLAGAGEPANPAALSEAVRKAGRQRITAIADSMRDALSGKGCKRKN